MTALEFFLYFAVPSFLLFTAKAFLRLKYPWWVSLVPLGLYAVIIIALALFVTLAEQALKIN